MKEPLLIITGPTAVGKTALSVELAKRLNGEIISADSMQVYRHMDIGSAKITREEMKGISHHLIDILEPDREFNVVLFQKLAKQAVREIRSRNRLPIIAGGTGFYIQALLCDINFTETEGDGGLRRQFEQLAAREGAGALHALLEEIDPESARSIHENNVKRVIRALEYHRQTGQKISEHNEKERQREPAYDVLYYVLTADRQTLYERIDRRVDQMMEAGLLEEVKELKKAGLNRHMVSMQGLGYKELLDYLEGAKSLPEAVKLIKRDTRHFAKRQLTWFKRERDVRWIDLDEFCKDQNAVADYIEKEGKNRWNEERFMRCMKSSESADRY